MLQDVNDSTCFPFLPLSAWLVPHKKTVSNMAKQRPGSKAAPSGNLHMPTGVSSVVRKQRVLEKNVILGGSPEKYGTSTRVIINSIQTYELTPHGFPWGCKYHIPCRPYIHSGRYTKHAITGQNAGRTTPTQFTPPTSTHQHSTLCHPLHPHTNTHEHASTEYFVGVPMGNLQLTARVPISKTPCTAGGAYYLKRNAPAMAT